MLYNALKFPKMHFSTVVGNNFCVTGFPNKLHSTVIFWQQNTVLQGNYKESFKVEIFKVEKSEFHVSTIWNSDFFRVNVSTLKISTLKIQYCESKRNGELLSGL